MSTTNEAPGAFATVYQMIACCDCGELVEVAHYVGDRGHDDDYGPVPTVMICETCLEDRRRIQ